MNEADSGMGGENLRLSWRGNRPQEGRAACLLLVSEDPSVLGTVQRDIERALTIPRSLICATNLSDLWAALNSQIPDVLILDSAASGTPDIFDLLAALRGRASTAALPVVVLARNAGEAARSALWPGLRTLVKPFGPLELCALLEEALSESGGPPD